jgi:succinate dehydrogenase / fumarate reductase cytochrome b subunit
VKDPDLWRRLWATAVGRKAVMAVSGLLMIGFLVTHLAGNLLVFAGPATFNGYSHSLLSPPMLYLTYAIEVALLLLFVAHIVAGVVTLKRNRQARPVGYQQHRWAGGASHKSLASTTMILSGLVIFVFVPLHLWTFKFGPHYVTATEPHIRDLYRLVIEEFHEPGEVVWYVVAMIVIGFHLWHGFGSAFDSLGVAAGRPMRRLGHALALVLAGGFALIPLTIALFVGGPR